MKIFLIALIISISLQLFSENSQQIEPKIVNGTETSASDWNIKFSGVVGVIGYLGGNEGFTCSGTLIAPNVVLTAGHCVFLRDESGNIEFDGVSNPSQLSVHEGLKLSYHAKKASVSKAVAHESWNGELGGTDIAVILLNINVTDLMMYKIRDNPAEQKGEKGIIVGYGITGEDKVDSMTQRWGNTTILDVDTGNQLLEIGNPSGTCQGDSGGPLFTLQNNSYVVSGISSFGRNGCSATENSFHTRVIAYRSWINEKMIELTGHDLETICGDGDLDAGETCERGDSVDCSTLGNFERGSTATCLDDCKSYNINLCEEMVCGNGIVNSNEMCDDGNNIDNDDCSNDCRSVRIGECGDGIVQSPEECDDGNWDSYDECNNDCQKNIYYNENDGQGGCTFLII